MQTVLDEYMKDLIRETDFVGDARAWMNYADYRDMVEYAKAAGLPVIAANAPRRYVGMVGKRGSKALEELPPSSHSHLPPLPIAPPSDGYRDKFNLLMRMLHASAAENAASPAPPAATGMCKRAVYRSQKSHTSTAENAASPAPPAATGM